MLGTAGEIKMSKLGFWHLEFYHQMQERGKYKNKCNLTWYTIKYHKRLTA